MNEKVSPNNDTKSDIATIIQIPFLMFIGGYTVSTSDGFYKTETTNYGWDVIYYYHSKSVKQHHIIVKSNVKCNADNRNALVILFLIALIFTLGVYSIVM